MKNKPVFYIDAIRLIKHIALKNQSVLENQSISENPCPWMYIKYRDLNIKINRYYHIIYVGSISINVPPLVINKHPHHRPLNNLTDYLYKIFDEKSRRREIYDNGNSLEIYTKHLEYMKSS